jgi:hypothetical protein
MLKDHWAVLTHTRRSEVTLATVIGQYHAWGVVPLRRRSLHLCEMTADRAPWTGTMTAPAFLSPNEIQRRVVLAIGKSTFTWPSARLLPMLPNGETEKFVSCFFFRQVPRKLGISGLCRSSQRLLMAAALPTCFSVEVRPSCAGEGASPGGGDLQAQLGDRGEAACCEQGAAQGAGGRQARLE